MSGMFIAELRDLINCTHGPADRHHRPTPEIWVRTALGHVKCMYNARYLFTVRCEFRPTFPVARFRGEPIDPRPMLNADVSAFGYCFGFDGIPFEMGGNVEEWMGGLLEILTIARNGCEKIVRFFSRVVFKIFSLILDSL